MANGETHTSADTSGNVARSDVTHPDGVPPVVDRKSEVQVAGAGNVHPAEFYNAFMSELSRTWRTSPSE